ncbi:Serine aminopeptidase, S33 [Paractinoplanes atraurantiacus]|uniref:Serine aminopeptidase, S33 n=1 Tax=Paractinoplanes atraurantiacus TaxID=1036182 RepID=A0A285HS24_9ACTN|nr:Serine aminopeptidase, S33 [Actinoplanes atraurantiacus]
MAQDVREAVAGLSEYVLVGHSMGGKVAQLVAAGQPDGLTGLVLVAPAPAEPAEMITPEYQGQLSHAYDSMETVTFARDHILTASPLPDHLAAQVIEDSLSAGPEAPGALAAYLK